MGDQEEIDPVDLSVTESESMVSFDRSSSSLENLDSKCFTFRFERAASDANKEVGIFEAVANGEVLRRNVSEPFERGIFGLKKTKATKVSFNVILKKLDSSAKVANYFKVE